MEPLQRRLEPTLLQGESVHDLKNANHTIAMGALLLSRLWGDLAPHLEELFETLDIEHNSATVYQDIKLTLPQVVQGIAESSGKIERLLAANTRSSQLQTVLEDV